MLICTLFHNTHATSTNVIREKIRKRGESFTKTEPSQNTHIWPAITVTPRSMSQWLNILPNYAGYTFPKKKNDAMGESNL